MIVNAEWEVTWKEEVVVVVSKFLNTLPAFI
jgi:hypothetical protein